MILIVDDSPDSAEALQRMLVRRGLPVAYARSGQEAFEFARKTTPTAIVMDSMMPGMSGEETVRRLREFPAMKKTPVIFFTGKPVELAEQENLGAVAVFTKGKAHLDEVARCVENAHRSSIGEIPAGPR